MIMVICNNTIIDEKPLISFTEQVQRIKNKINVQFLNLLYGEDKKLAERLRPVYMFVKDAYETSVLDRIYSRVWEENLMNQEGFLEKFSRIVDEELEIMSSTLPDSKVIKELINDICNQFIEKIAVNH